jgi:hypothetical protein
MAIRDWTSRHRILSAWLLVALVAVVGWGAGTLHVNRYVESLSRDEICADVGVTLRDTTIIGAEQARRDSAALAERNCAARYTVAREGRRTQVFIPLALLVGAGTLVASLFSIGWLVRRAWAWFRAAG